MGPASLGLDIGIFCDFLYSVLLMSAILGLDFLGLALSRPQVLFLIRDLLANGGGFTFPSMVAPLLVPTRPWALKSFVHHSVYYQSTSLQ